MGMSFILNRKQQKQPPHMLIYAVAKPMSDSAFPLSVLLKPPLILAQSWS